MILCKPKLFLEQISKFIFNKIILEGECPQRDLKAAAAQGRRCRRACSPSDPCPRRGFQCLCAGACGLSCVRKGKIFQDFFAAGFSYAQFLYTLQNLSQI